jgi:hypothetical protein
MKQLIVADGAIRVIFAPEMQARLRVLRESIRARHAEELARAGFFGRIRLRWRMEREYRRERRRLLPSGQALYATMKTEVTSRG